jgi:hypothetical protein
MTRSFLSSEALPAFLDGFDFLSTFFATSPAYNTSRHASRRSGSQIAQVMCDENVRKLAAGY